MDNFVEGNLVSFKLEDGSDAMGRVEYVMTEGSIGVAGSEYSFPASSDDPILLVRLFSDSDETELLTGRKSSEVSPYVEDVHEDEDELMGELRLSAMSIGRAIGEAIVADWAAESYAIPTAVKNNARSGLELRKKFGRGGTSVGENTARTLAAGGSIGIEKVRHIARYFPRHAGDNLDDKTSNGWIAWQLWGGHSARSWSNAIVARADKKESK